MAPRKNPLRVLCLHGFRANVQVMEDQTRALRQALGPDPVEFVFLNGPFEAEGLAFPAIEEHYKESRPFYEWFQYYIGDSKTSTEITPEEVAAMRREPKENVWLMRFGGMDHALAYLDAKLRELGPFDVAIGFSQGALMTTLFSMWSLKTHNERPWKLSVCVNTSRIHAINFRHLFESSDGDGRELLVPLPSVHLVGKKDPIAVESMKMVAMYESHPTGSPTGKIVLEHQGGHHFPSIKRDKEVYATLAEVMNQYRSEGDDDEAVERVASRL
ncbi:hypothetical protein Gpo141_00006207 [Globisporangium polare]